MSLWHALNKFPIQFKSLNCLEKFDETEEITEMLGKLTPSLADVFEQLQLTRTT